MPIDELQERVLVPVRGEPFEQAGIAEWWVVKSRILPEARVTSPSLCRAEAYPNARFSGLSTICAVRRQARPSQRPGGPCSR